MNHEQSRREGIAALVLAAGASSRMGKPKPLIAWGETSLLRHVCGVALASACQEVWVVLGNQASALQAELGGLAVRIVVADDWQSGMSASLRAGVAALPASCSAALVLLCDQPHVTPDLIDQLIDARREHRTIAASSYGGTLGPPALFGPELFPELMRLQGDHGAKTLLTRDPTRVAAVPFPDGLRDLDTPADLENEKPG